MKKTITFTVLSLVLILGHSASAHADPGHKLYRGLVNIVTAPVEIPKQTRAYWIKGAQKTVHISANLLSGAVWGIVQGVKRLGSGVWDTLSFPFDLPPEGRPLLKPEFVFDEWPRNPVSGR